MELTIDTASPLAGIALTDQGALIGEYAWLSRRGHAAELLPAIDRLLDGAGASKAEIDAIFVNRGPGAYAGLRVGISTALALAFALDTGLLAFGRLEADAYPFLDTGRPVCAVHDAGRGELAWAVYEAATDGPRELLPPRIGPPDAVASSVPAGALVVGEPDRVIALLPRSTAVIAGPAARRRAGSGAALAWPRWAAGARDNRLALTPLYLREPNITQPRPRPTPTGRQS